MILLIDNYDSFTYNLVQVIGEIAITKTPDLKQEEYIKVVRNDEITIEEIEQMNPSHIILSPGPGRPKDAGVCEEVIEKLGSKYKMLGVCLGHQAICETFGATITYADHLMHGKQSDVTLDNKETIFKGLKPVETVARYHSLVADAKTMPEVLKVIAKDEKGEIMAVKHKDYEIYGLQFHPESVLTPNGKTMLENFIYE